MGSSNLGRIKSHCNKLLFILIKLAHLSTILLCCGIINLKIYFIVRKITFVLKYQQPSDRSDREQSSNGLKYTKLCQQFVLLFLKI